MKVSVIDLNALESPLEEILAEVSERILTVAILRLRKGIKDGRGPREHYIKAANDWFNNDIAHDDLCDCGNAENDVNFKVIKSDRILS